MIKLNWLKGKSLGLALIYLGIMGLFQILFIAIAQYGMKVGSQPITILVPLAVILSTFYCVLVIFESYTSINEYRSSHSQKHKKSTRKQGFIKDLLSNIYYRPVIYVVGIFTAIFLLIWLFIFAFIEESWIVFIIADVIAAIAVIIIASYIERAAGRKTR